MDKLELILPTSIKNELIEHAKSLAPIESCGYLSGNNDTVTRFFPMTNIDHSPEHFSFDPKEQFAVVKDVRNQNEKRLRGHHSIQKAVWPAAKRYGEQQERLGQKNFAVFVEREDKKRISIQ